MSMLPLLLHHHGARPTLLQNQQFGHVFNEDDLLAPLHLPRDMGCLVNHGGYCRPWRPAAAHHDIGSTVTMDRERFHVNLDIQHFAPEEVTVKITGENQITIEGKHEEKEDEHGFISRHFLRRYLVPKGHDLEKTESKVSSDGVLTVMVPKIHQGEIEHKMIPITRTGKPSKAIKKEEGKKPDWK